MRVRRFSYTRVRSIENPKFAVGPTVVLPGHTRIRASDLEDRIRQLCASVLATDDDEEMNRWCVELRDALSRPIAR